MKKEFAMHANLRCMQGPIIIFKAPHNAPRHGVQNDCDSDSSSISYGDINSVTADVHTLRSDDHGPIFCHMLIRKQYVGMQIDCGSTVNILPKKYVEDKDIRPESVTLKMWNNMKTEALGKCRAKSVNPATGDLVLKTILTCFMVNLDPFLVAKSISLWKQMLNRL